MGYLKRMLKGIAMRRSVIALVALAASWLPAFIGVQAAPSDSVVPPIQAYFGPEKVLGVVLSPNGRLIATTVPHMGRMNLAIVDIEARSIKVLTSYDRFDVVNINWVSSKRLVFSLGNVNEPRSANHQRGGGLYAVDRDGANARVLTESVEQQQSAGSAVYRGLSYVERVRGSDGAAESDDILATSNERSEKVVDIVRLNTRTGRKQLLTANVPGEVQDWVLDHDGVPRVAIMQPSGTEAIVLYREGADAPWNEIHRAQLGPDSFDPGLFNFVPLAFTADNKSLYVASNQGGRDRAAIFKFDPVQKIFGELIAEHPMFDVTGDLRFGRDGKTLVGVSINADRPMTKWFDPEYTRIQKMLDSTFPATYNTFTRTSIGGDPKALVVSRSDRQPARYYLFDDAKRTLEEILSTNDQLGPDQLVEQRPIVIPTRDGKRIPGYLFLPKTQSTNQKLPLLVDVHGGPMVRADYWGYPSGIGVKEGQYFASRGYAVILPNFRLTPGFGADLFTSGLRQLGRKMSEDKEDAVAWAVNQGFADPKRVCIFGHSYGGYATLAGLIKTPDLYRCGVASMAPSDMRLMLTSGRGNIPANKNGVEFWEAIVGDLKTEASFIDETSPAYHADRIKSPLLLIHGEDDTQVPLEQAERMRAALRKVGTEPEWLVVPEEGHGFGKAENRYLVYTRMLEFFDRNLGVTR